MKILLFGSSGQLGKTLAIKLQSFQLKRVNSMECNFNDEKKIKDIIKKFKPRLIINAAAYTNVDDAEINKNDAFQINSKALSVIGRESKKINAIVIHFSTDYVFNGEKEDEYSESDKKHPLSIYGLSKSSGEDLLIEATDKYFILRVSWLMSHYNNCFVDKIMHKLRNNKEVDVVSDQFGKMTSTEWLSEITYKLINKIKENKCVNFGTYHVACNGKISWFDIAETIANFMKTKDGKSRKVKKIKLNSLNLLARRPVYTQLATKKIENELNIQTPSWKSELNKILDVKIA